MKYKEDLKGEITMNILKELGIEKICVGEVLEQALNLHEGIGIGINNTTIRLVIKYGNLVKEEIDSLRKSITIRIRLQRTE